MAQNAEAVKNSRVIGQYSRWVNQVINGVLKNYELDESLIPESFGLNGVNIVRQNNGTVTIGFVFKEVESGTR